jgi:hypothetical protein
MRPSGEFPCDISKDGQSLDLVPRLSRPAPCPYFGLAKPRKRKPSCHDSAILKLKRRRPRPTVAPKIAHRGRAEGALYGLNQVDLAR